MMIPIGDRQDAQEPNVLYQNQDGMVTDRAIPPVAFVPLTGWPEFDVLVGLPQY